MNPLTWALVITGVTLNAAAQLLLKAATHATGPIAVSWDGVAAAVPRMLVQTGWWGGLACYAASVVVWVLALSRAPVSVLYPLLSIGYIVNAIGAALLFGEALPPLKIVGITVIILGVWILSYNPT
jgi:multidrug transporter EmrE-like cation transporter